MNDFINVIVFAFEQWKISFDHYEIWKEDDNINSLCKAQCYNSIIFSAIGKRANEFKNAHELIGYIVDNKAV